MRSVAVTGVPGTGKTTIARELARSFTIRDAMDIARSVGAVSGHDDERDVDIVDENVLKERARSALPDDVDVVVVEGHLAHFTDPDIVIVLRCRPPELEERLESKGWSEAKIAENLEAERLDATAFEVEADEVYELDTTHADPGELASIVARLARGETVKHERLGGLGAFDHLEE